ncbi:MAG TPA: hypothetical protein VNM90_15905 [Haliangium sp.]|nr:hypothetical protein [Haliangium sp.]
MKHAARIDAPSTARRVRLAGSLLLAVLAAVAAGTGCQSDAPAELPLKPCGVEERFFGDEEQLFFVHRTYDENGNHVLSERDSNGDGVAEDRFVWQYAPAGGLTLLTQSFSSGTMHEVAAQYGNDGRLESVTWMTSNGMAGRADYEYDGERRILEHWDRNDDGVAEAITTYTYDAAGKLEGSSFGCTGVEPRSTTTMQWGEDGRIERIESRNDGEVTAATQYVYDQEGRLERWERSLREEVVSSATYEYDAAGNVTGTSAASILVLGQVPPTWSITDTVYDADGRVRSSQTATDGRISSSDTFLYECPDHEDSPGRRVGEPASPLPAPPVGPRGGMGFDAVFTYALSGSSCL